MSDQEMIEIMIADAEKLLDKLKTAKTITPSDAREMRRTMDFVSWKSGMVKEGADIIKNRS